MKLTQFKNPMHAQTRCRGAAYVISLLVTTVLASLVLVFAREMRVYTDSTANRVSALQARWVAYGALEAVRGDLANVILSGRAPQLDQVVSTGQVIGDGVFWLIRPNSTDDTRLSYGLQGEGGKINLDAFGGIDVLEITGMDESLAACIIDWQDRNERITPGGAESAYYLSRPTPYNISNRALESVGELLYVKGMTTDLLFGEDANRNYILDPNENDGIANPPDDNADGKLDRGFIDIFTIYSSDPGVSNSGMPKITLDIKQSQEELAKLRSFLASKVGEERAKQLAAASFNKTSSAGKNQTYTSVLEFYTETKATDSEFELVHDGLKRLDNEDEMEGLIDVYQASEQVLAALPGLDIGDARALINARPKPDPGVSVPNLSWIIGVLGEEKAIAAARYLTYRSCQFTADIVALSGDGRGFCRIRVVLDCSPVLVGEASLPEIRYVEDLSSYGWPMDESIREQLRTGASPAAVAAIINEDL